MAVVGAGTPLSYLGEAAVHLTAARAHLRFADTLVPDGDAKKAERSQLKVLHAELIDLVSRVDARREAMAGLYEVQDEQDPHLPTTSDLHTELKLAALRTHQAYERLQHASLQLGIDGASAVDVAAVSILAEEALDIRWRIDRHRAATVSGA